MRRLTQGRRGICRVTHKLPWQRPAMLRAVAPQKAVFFFSSFHKQRYGRGREAIDTPACALAESSRLLEWGRGGSHMRLAGNLTDFNCNTISSSAETRRTRPPTCGCEGREMRSGAGDGEQGGAKWLPVQMETLWGFWNACVSVCVCVWHAHERT